MPEKTDAGSPDLPPKPFLDANVYDHFEAVSLNPATPEDHREKCKRLLADHRRADRKPGGPVVGNLYWWREGGV